MGKNLGGVWPVDRIGRPHPFGVQWRERVRGDDGVERMRVKTEFFETAEKRDARAAVLRRDRKQGSLHTATRAELAEWRAFRASVNDTPWQNVVAGWRAWMMEHGLRECTVTVDDAVKHELARATKLVADNRMSAMTFRQKDHKLTLFADQFGHLRIDQIKASEIEEWIDDFDEVATEATFNNYRKHISTIFSHYVEDGTLRRNPVETVKMRDDSGGEVGILSVEETAHLFQFANGSDKYRVAIGRFALEAFVGLRFSSGCRLEKADINFEDRGILLPKRKIKTKKRHYIDGFPAQVWEWLAITPDGCWDLTPRQYLELKSNVFVEAGVPHPANCFRHSFCTYDVAAHKNPGRTASILCHKNQELLWSRYKGNATEAAGKLYQTISPTTAKALAKDYVPLAARVPQKP